MIKSQLSLIAAILVVLRAKNGIDEPGMYPFPRVSKHYKTDKTTL